MSDDKADTPVPPKPSIWPLIAMMMLTLWMCNRPSDPKHTMEQCGANLHKIGVALEKSRLTSEQALYPIKLEEAFGKNPLPVCPTGGKETYKLGYQPSSDRLSYLLVCKGDFHTAAGVPSDYPRIAFGPAEHAGQKDESKPSEIRATASPQAPAVDASATPAQKKPQKPVPSPQATTANP